ncbi:ABC transporter permease [Paeniglutamicibacter gangotriensis]|uniref:ABC-type transport system involved in multi-copper enzyme maturation, permease component n=2 Tax=Paeniglutamicibacter gangotriensis TaxID=254787 RepID=M7MUN3_9MICC|nr:ABC transporter involved in multi-copper enzyme maturation permease [Paeniglutamicibacter gangotriensis]EMR00158.1 ABC-type transport system involved in multi-copper enzyme maturation, permease component [Paeniglutamicibacter gangotriensis Lz1y]KAA0979369.1 ABC transporter permease [Paeniglutamicibacter gangotriensis]
MSTETMKRPRSAEPGAAGSGKLKFSGVLRSEFIKFFSLPSTLILILSTLVVMVGFAALSAWGIGVSMEAMASDPEMMAQMGVMGDMETMAAAIPGSGLMFAQLIMGALAVMVMSSEFATGAARSTFVAVPNRQLVLGAKTLLVSIVSIVVALVSLLLSYLLAKPIAENYKLSLEFSSEAFQRQLWFGVLYVLMVSLIALALGALLRNSAGGIVVLAALFFVLPIAVGSLSSIVSWLADVARFLPDAAGTALMMMPGADNALETWASGLVVAGWCIIPLAFAAVTLQRRDI